MQTRLVSLTVAAAVSMSLSCGCAVHNVRNTAQWGNANVRTNVLPSLPTDYPVRQAGEPRPVEKIHGEWELVQLHNSIASGAAHPKPFEYSQVIRSKYTFFDDGMLMIKMSLSAKETTWRGTWTYADGRLVMNTRGQDGKESTMDMLVLWHSDTEIELRYADLRAYERMFYVSEYITGMRAYYESSGVLRTSMDMTINGGVTTTNAIYSPMVLERLGDAIDD